MSASSGMKGWCRKCGHTNNEHNYHMCEAHGCRKRFKVCQVGHHDPMRFGKDGTVEADSHLATKRGSYGPNDGVHYKTDEYILCGWCPDHPYQCSNIEADIKRASKTQTGGSGWPAGNK